MNFTIAIHIDYLELFESSKLYFPTISTCENVSNFCPYQILELICLFVHVNGNNQKQICWAIGQSEMQ